MTEDTTKYTYTLTMTKKQVWVLQHALEVLARLQIGQISTALDAMQNTDGQPYMIDWETTKIIEDLVKPKIGLTRNSSYGVGKFKNADIAWDIYEVIRNQLSWDSSLENGEISKERHAAKQRSPGMYGVCYDEPMHWNHEESLIKIEKTS